jgi:hypothetical protein
VKSMRAKVALFQCLKSHKSKTRRANNVTRKTSSLLLFGLAKGVIAMRESKTYFGQIPISVVKKIAVVHDGVARNDNADTRALPSKLKPHRSASLRKQQLKAGSTMKLSELNCSICGKSVTLETAKTDEVGRAAHGECYLLKLGIKPDHNSVQASKSAQNAELRAS